MAQFWMGAILVFMIVLTLANLQILGQMIKLKKETVTAIEGVISVIEIFRDKVLKPLEQRHTDVMKALDGANIPASDNVVTIDTKGPKDVG